jgi:hypothetical protein
MKTNRSWRVTRSGIARSDGERRWDYAYQFLLQWAMDSDTDTQSVSAPAQQEESHGNRSVCPGFDASPTTGSDD